MRPTRSLSSRHSGFPRPTTPHRSPYCFGSGMQLGVIGLGRMGRIVVDRTLAAGHDVVAFDLDDEAVASAADAGADPADSLADFVDQLGSDKRIWLMVPAGEAVDVTLEELEGHLDS